MKQKKLIDAHILTIGDLKTKVTLNIYLTVPNDTSSHSISQDKISIALSHGIKTPVQAGPVYPDLSRYQKWTRDSCDAIVEHVRSQYVMYYDMATAEGHAPEESWLVPEVTFEK